MVIAGHATLVNGKIFEAPVNTLIESLCEDQQSFVHLRHSIDGSQSSYIFHYAHGRLLTQQQLFGIRHPSILRYLTEVLGTIGYFLMHRHAAIAYVGADPLNAATGLVLRRLGMAEKVVFYAADYATRRFPNAMMNKLYHALDRWCVRNADQVWNVSSRIHAIHERMGVPKERNIFVPNVPSREYTIHLQNRRDPYRLVTLGVIGEQLDFENIFQAIARLKNDFPNLTFIIIGTGPQEQAYRQRVEHLGLSGVIHFLGHLSHDRALQEISRSGIGLALYNGKWGFNYFGDSMKCREFFCFGLPVLTTDTHSTVEEIRRERAGIICPLSADAYAKALVEILQQYPRYSQAASRLAERYNGIHKKVLASLS